MKWELGPLSLGMWIDTRLENPSPNAFSKYVVIFKLADDITAVGFADWIPKDGYTSGEWGEVCFPNGNQQGACPVLYWMEWPKGLEK